MISYSTNWMGPVSSEWYRARGLTEIVTRTVDTEAISELFGKPIGETFELEEITERWCGGRIDISGLNEKEFYCGMSEYGLEVMDQQSWYLLTEWLDEFESDFLLTKTDLINKFERETGHKIRWAKDVFDVR